MTGRGGDGQRAVVGAVVQVEGLFADKRALACLPERARGNVADVVGVDAVRNVEAGLAPLHVWVGVRRALHGGRPFRCLRPRRAPRG